MAITKLNQIFDQLKGMSSKKRLVVAFGNDEHSIEAAYRAQELGIVEVTIVGDEATIKEVCAKYSYDVSKIKIVQEAEETAATIKAVELINAGEGDIIMKGLCSTDKYMRAILNKEKGLLPPKAILTHVSIMEFANYHKLLVVSDVAIIPNPDFKQKLALVNYVVKTSKALGVEKPKVAMIAASEQVLPTVVGSTDAAIIAKMSNRGQIPGCYVDGPLALDTAIDAEAVAIKKLVSTVAGDADCLVFPNLESGNVFYKASTKLANAGTGAMLVGAKVPSVLSSRGDSVQTKLNSIALAAMTAR